MDKSIVFYLVKELYATDRIGQKVATLVRRRVMGRVTGVTRSEWAAAGEHGIKPEMVVHMFGPDYDGERTVQIVTADGTPVPYGIYRVHHGRNDDLELYLEHKAGETIGDAEIVRPVVTQDRRPLLTSDGRLLVVGDQA